MAPHRAPDRPVLRRLAAFGLGVLVVAVGLEPAGAQPVPSATAPTPAETVQTNWRMVDGGLYHTCGIKTSGRLFCWGEDDDGQLGDGSPSQDQLLPVEVAGGITNWASVSAGDFHTCAVRTTGRLYCWGNGYSGQGGWTGYGPRPEPDEVFGNRSDWASVSAGSAHTCARTTSGRVFCWGEDDDGQVGNGPSDGITTRWDIPQPVGSAAATFSQVSAGGNHTCGRRTTGRLFCWGDDGVGQLGDGGASSGRHSPVQVAGNATDWAMVSAGSGVTCARKQNRRLFCWGSDQYGRLGDGGGTTNRGTPVQVAGNATNWASVSAGQHVCARKTDGRLFCWGRDHYGQLGDGGPIDTGDRQHAPVRVLGGPIVATTVTVGTWHSCARRLNGALACWGDNFHGTLGDGTTTGRSSPVAVQG